MAAAEKLEDPASPSAEAAAPPAGAAPAVDFVPAPAASSALDERGAVGFTSVIRHLSLRGWLRWIHSNRSDATLRVRTRDGGSGRIWCSAGKIVDAEWGGLGPEEAARQMLSLSSGAVTIDFDHVDRPRRVARSTHELLHVPEGSDARVSEVAHAEAALASSRTGSLRSEPFHNSLFLPLASALPSARGSVLRPPADPRRISRGEYLAGIFLLAALAVAAFAFGRLRAASNTAALAEAAAVQTEQTRSGLLPPPGAGQLAEAQTITPEPLELPLIPFVAIEVDPPGAEIWLDQALIGTGRIQLAAIRDGMMHELRFMAPGYETKSLFYRDTPPAGRVILTRAAEPAAISETANGVPSAAVETAGDLAKRAFRRRTVPLSRPAPAAETPPAAKPTQSKKSPQVQLIEVQTPRVQVLD